MKLVHDAARREARPLTAEICVITGDTSERA